MAFISLVGQIPVLEPIWGDAVLMEFKKCFPLSSVACQKMLCSTFVEKRDGTKMPRMSCYCEEKEIWKPSFKRCDGNGAGNVIFRQVNIAHSEANMTRHHYAPIMQRTHPRHWRHLQRLWDTFFTDEKTPTFCDQVCILPEMFHCRNKLFTHRNSSNGGKSQIYNDSIWKWDTTSVTH